ncbi:TIGR02679 domain-containing protein [Exiguobacterium antarcticum]|uniref:TIGR02679 domain-containing protein n=1 Tax=Exiguobacterium antarcticum TaxID=132920 RepID=UPI000AB8B0E4|nr:TIGR02679 domain-containing protein [Exiguobacterium antarcticum]
MEEALHYFQQANNFERLFQQFRKKYSSYGRVGGSISIQTFPPEDQQAIALFLSEDVEDLRHRGTVTLLRFERRLQQSRFEGIMLPQLLEAYFDVPLQTNHEVRFLAEQQKRRKWSRLRSAYPELIYWFNHLERKTPDTLIVHRTSDLPRFEQLCEQLERLDQSLPFEYERIPLYAQRITGDPHALDRDTELGKLFIHLLHVKDGRSGAPLMDSENLNELYLRFHLLRDDVLNFVTCTNLLADTDGVQHEMWEGAATRRSVLNVPIRELLKVDRIYGEKRTVWIVENSGVFSELLDFLPDMQLVCTHGQFKLAAYRLLDHLVASGHHLRYAGDLDPEGLQMAARLKLRYGDRLTYWCLDESAYLHSKSGVLLSNERLAKLNSIQDGVLEGVVEHMRAEKRAGYQEALLARMIDEYQMVQLNFDDKN